jgi:serine/threonine protein phosphatase PrpC
MQNYHVISDAKVPEHPTEQTASPPRSPIAEVTFSLDPDGIYLPPQTLALSCATPGARVRYSLGSETLSTDDAIFDPAQPLVLTQSTRIAAQAFQGEEAGPVSLVFYTIKGALWQQREPEDVSDPTPHQTHDTASLPDNWRLAAASVRGKLHAHRALWREDSYDWAPSENWTIAIVSDGAGSAPLSRVGSALICRVAKDSLQSALANFHLSENKDALATRDLPRLRAHLVQAAQSALEALHQEAASRDRALADFASTLLVLVLCPFQSGHLLACLQIGDGALAVYSHTNELRVLGVADHGEHSSETRFLTTRGLEAELSHRVTFEIQPHIQGVALMTDGVSDDFFPEEKRLGELFESILPQLRQSEDAGQTVLKWLGYEKKGSSDDRTLLVLWPQSSEKNRESESTP